MSEYSKRQDTGTADGGEEEREPFVGGEKGNGKGEPAPEGGEVVVLSPEEYGDLKAQISDLKDRYLRVAADFDNYRKRTEKEKEDIVCYANERLVSDLLPILDNLERALATDPRGVQVEGILDGVRMVSQQLHAVLTGCGLEPVHAVGSAFDPKVHEAVGVLPSGDHAEGTVLAELQKGYKLKGKVLRPSVVHVAGQRTDGSEESER